MASDLKAILEKRIIECLEFADKYPLRPINLITLQLNKTLLKKLEDQINNGKDAKNVTLRAHR
jgi:hypothetical protein